MAVEVAGQGRSGWRLPARARTLCIRMTINALHVAWCRRSTKQRAPSPPPAADSLPIGTLRPVRSH